MAAHVFLAVQNKTHIFSTFFYENLVNNIDLKKEKRHKNVASWTKNVDIFDARIYLDIGPNSDNGLLIIYIQIVLNRLNVEDIQEITLLISSLMHLPFGPASPRNIGLL